MTEYIVKIPEWYLLVIATRGDMGDDDLPELVQTWAEKECARLGLNKKLREERRENLKRLRKRMKKALGNDLTKEIEEYFNDDFSYFVRDVFERK